MDQKEFYSPLSLHDEKGQVQNFGWARQPYFVYDSALSYMPKYKITEADRYIVFSPTHMVIFEVRDDGWLGHMGISVISLRDKKRSTQVFKSLLPLGDYDMPSNSVHGSVHWHKKDAKLDFISMEGGAKIIKADIRNFGHHRSFRGALVLCEYDAPIPEAQLNAQSLVTSQQWKNQKNTYRLTRCSPWFFAEGVIQFSSAEIIFTRGNAWGILDWMRCARPKADIRYWAGACGISGGRQLSFCVGYSWADFSHGTENGFFVDGILHKLDQVTFHIPFSNWLAPWRFTSNDNRLEMTFHPHQERADRRRLFLHNLTRHQLCGFFSGRIVLDDGAPLEFQNLTGFAEWCRMRY
ncbi:MAG: DUF2804 domain-containing protein [Treponema sp.]|nr:DUF2804 domain-containing protein [Treponema sp.]